MDNIIHQIWVGPLPMPLHIRYFVKDIKDKNPNREHRLWTDHNLPVLPSNMKSVYDMFGDQKKYALQADILRLFLIKEYGGLYLDADFSQIGPLDDIFEKDNIFCELNGVLLNGMFGSAARNPDIENACKNVNHNTFWYGPTWFDKMINKEHANIITLNDFESKYAKHHALFSWANK